MAQNCSCCPVFNQEDNKHDLSQLTLPSRCLFLMGFFRGPFLSRIFPGEDHHWWGPLLTLNQFSLIWGRLVIWRKSPICFWDTGQLICKARKVNLLRNSWSPPSGKLRTEKEQWKLTWWLQGSSVVKRYIWGQETQTHSVSVTQWRQRGYISLPGEFSIIVSASWDLKISHKKWEEGMHTGKARSKIQALINVTVTRQ